MTAQQAGVDAIISTDDVLEIGTKSSTVPFAPSTYTVGSTGVAEYFHSGNGNAGDGTIVFSVVSDATVTGTFDVTLGGGYHLTGSFSGPVNFAKFGCTLDIVGHRAAILLIVGIAFSCGGKEDGGTQDAASWAAKCLSSAGPTLLLPLDGSLQIMNVVASDGYVYWAETLTDTPKTSAVWRVRTSGEGAEQLATLHNDYGDEVAIGVSSKFVAVVTYNVGDQLFLVSKADHSIRSVGGHLDVNSQLVALDDANAYVGTETNALMAVPLDGSPPHAVATGLSAAPYVGALDSQRVYASLMFGPIVAVDWAGTVTQLATGGFPLAVDADAIYVASQDQHIERIALADGTTTTLAPQSSLTGPWALAIDSSFVYWSDHAGISRVAKTGGSVENITSSGGAVTVDDSCVYWFSDGIWTAPK